MMPGTIAERRTEPATVEVAERIDVAGLTHSERTVALYASDMPNVKRHHTGEQVRAWIVQGAERFGMEEVRCRAEYLHGWRLLNVKDLLTAQIQARHEQRFPRARRLLLADQAASESVCCSDGMTNAARERNAAAQVDGGCPVCEGARQVWGRWVIDAESDWYEDGYRPCWICSRPRPRPLMGVAR
ncbi:hypothetical protein [Streptomyces sp. GSL17-111]|uniref:hypothetical protein n=1 Tax=Streptomyces sp. GSL17-111 TaxID=3121596 RepID=UPI0030F3CF23